MRLTCIGRYQNGDDSYLPGQAVDVSDEEGAFLMRDSPGSFVIGEVGAVAVSETASGTATATRPAPARARMR